VLLAEPRVRTVRREDDWPPEARTANQLSRRSAILVGAGPFGGWTALYLREMGFSVTLVDQYENDLSARLRDGRLTREQSLGAQRE
jgi:NADPH-dependent 2,4-dienoyl-CoA reductase/sulfur reductase-like enzyme